MSDLYIGLISGTSMDGIDAALARFDEDAVDVLETLQYDYPDSLRQALLNAIRDSNLRSTEDVTELHRDVGNCFADAAIALLELAGVKAETVSAIGSHGQTLRHEPEGDPPFSLQAGDPAIIAARTGITTVADFRSRDIAYGGQGAPLAPALHDWLFRQSGAFRVVANIGGIANVTMLPGDDSAATGFDTGPGNTLLDAWIRQHQGARFDRDGRWAASGNVVVELLERLLADPYFALPAPKSTGFEYFNLDWLHGHGISDLHPADVQATLCALTARSLADAIDCRADAVYVCGGGVHNPTLMGELRQALKNTSVASTAAVGLDPDWVEAAAFAWLAMRTMRGLPGNLPSVTGARQAVVLGDITEPA